MNASTTWIKEEITKLDWLLTNKDKILCITDDEWEEIEEIRSILKEHPNGVFKDESMAAHLLETISDRLHCIRVDYAYRQTLLPERIQ